MRCAHLKPIADTSLARRVARSAVAVICALWAANAVAQQRAVAAAAPSAPAVRVLQVRSNVYMLSGAGGNVTVQIGKHGVLLVDAPLPEHAQAASRKSRACPPIRFAMS
jgi:hypothetical protein